MNEQQVQTLLNQAAALVEQFDRRCETTSRELQRLIQQIPSVVRTSTDEQIRRIPAEVMSSIRSGLGQPVAAYEQRLRDAGETLHSGATAISGQVRRSEGLHKHLVWKVMATTAVSLLFLLAGGALLSKHYYDEVRKNQISAELLKAYNEADVTLCEGRLCAKVDPGTKYGEYVLVQPRQEQPRREPGREQPRREQLRREQPR